MLAATATTIFIVSTILSISTFTNVSAFAESEEGTNQKMQQDEGQSAANQTGEARQQNISDVVTNISKEQRVWEQILLVKLQKKSLKILGKNYKI